MKVLTEVEQQKFDIFQNAIHNDGLPPWEAASLLGDANYKILGDKVKIYQIRLSGGQRVHFEIEGNIVIIRQVGGHT